MKTMGAKVGMVIILAVLGLKPRFVVASEAEGISPGDNGSGPSVFVPGSTNITIYGKVPSTKIYSISRSERGSNSYSRDVTRAPGVTVTPGGLLTTPGPAANISNTPSNITPATTPPPD